jgi:hypothetical protein
MAQRGLTIEEDSIKKNKPKPVYQLDQRNSFLGKKAININGFLVGLEFKEKHQFSIGVYTLSPWKRPTPIVKNDSTTEIIKFYFYYASLGYNRTLLNTKRFKISIPVELGLGYSKATATIYQFQKEYTGSSPLEHFIPAQIGIFGEFKVTPWFGINGSIGYRKLLFQKLIKNPINLNYDGIYYYYGINLYFDQVFKDFKRWRTRVKEHQEISETKNKFIIRSGANLIRMRDGIISSFDYHAITIPAEMQFIHQGKKIEHSIQGTFNLFNLKTNTNEGFYYTNTLIYPLSIDGLDRQTIKAMMLNFRYGAVWKILNKKKLQMSVGPEYNYTLLTKDFLFLKYNNRLSEQFNSLNLLVKLHYKLSPKDDLSYSLSSNLFNYSSRVLSINHANYNYFTEFSFLSDYFSINSNLTYRFRITKVWSADVRYTFQYFQNNYPRNERQSNQGLTVGGVYNF